MQRSAFPRRKTRLRPISGDRMAEFVAAGRVPTSTLDTLTPKLTRASVRYVPSGPTRAVVDAVLDRDGFSCLVCGRGLADRRGVDYSIHHRLRRSQGLDNSMPNLVSLCGSATTGDHGAVHARPKWAREFGGWLLKGRDDPAAYPVLIERGTRWVRLTADGLYVPSAPPAGVAA